MPLIVKNSSAKPTLLAWEQEREAWLSRTQQMLEQDTRVVAAWLFGSLGRGTADELSDVDIFIVLDDSHAETGLLQRHEHIRAVAAPLLVLDAPQNRPPQGAYNMALYAGQYGPHQVDWYWQPQSFASIPTETRLLFDRVGLPQLETPPQFEYQPVPARTRAQAIAQAVNFFWVMLLIAAKHAARKPEEAGLGLLSYPFASLQEVYAFTEDATPLPSAGEVAYPDFAAKLRLMRVLAKDMEQQMPKLAAQNIPVPDAVAPSVHLYFDFIKDAATLTGCCLSK